MNSETAKWEDVTVSDFGEVVAGGTPSRANPSFWNGSVPWITPGEITALASRNVSDTREKLTLDGLAASAARLLPIGSLLVTTRATLGRVAIAGIPVSTNQGFKNIVPNQKTDSLFAYYRMGALRAEMERLASGTTFLEISKADFCRIRTQRPPLKQQRSIAAVLNIIDEAIATAVGAVAKLRNVSNGMLHDLMTCGIDANGELRDPISRPEQFKDSLRGRIPREWDTRQLRELVPRHRRITYGIVQPGEFDPNGVLLIRGQDYIDGWADRDEYFRVAPSLHQSYRRSTTGAGDLLLCIVGATTGAVAQVPAWIAEANITQTTARIACEAGLLNPRFGFHFLRSWHGQTQIRRYIKGSAQPGLNLRDVELLVMPVPDAAEQVAIAQILDSSASQIDATEEGLKKLRSVKAGVMFDLLTGRVRVPEDLKIEAAP